MKKIFILLAIVIPFIVSAQNSDLSGSWREVRRMGLNGRAQNFNDTIKIDFLTGQEYTWFKKGGFIYRGTYKIENGALDMGSRYFKIIEQHNDKLVISDDGAIYEFHPYRKPDQNRLPEEAPPMPVSSLSQLTGKWKVFKGTSSATIKELDLSNRVKTVVVFDRPDAEGDIGYVSGGKDPKGMPSWKINRFDHGIFYCNGKTVRLFEVIKADKELVIREGTMTYFLKQFNE